MARRPIRSTSAAALLEPFEVRAIIEKCRQAWDVPSDAEITLEANPETATPERLAGLRAAGVNRLSIGVQSFSDTELRRLSRLHSADKGQQRSARPVPPASTISLSIS